jgi:hypothetical protein
LDPSSPLAAKVPPIGQIINARNKRASAKPYPSALWPPPLDYSAAPLLFAFTITNITNTSLDSELNWV